MIETIVFGEAYDGAARFEADLEDGVAFITVRLVNNTNVPFHAQMCDDTGRVVTVDAAPGETAETQPWPPVFRLDFPVSPNSLGW